jgi:hypothetical protein
MKQPSPDRLFQVEEQTININKGKNRTDHSSQLDTIYNMAKIRYNAFPGDANQISRIQIQQKSKNKHW